MFAGDLPDEQARADRRDQRPVAELAFSEPNGAPAWKDLPSWAVVATGDKAAGTDVVRSMAERAGATITEVDGSHVIMVSQPDAVANVILERGGCGRRTRRERRAEMSVETSHASAAPGSTFGPVAQIEAGRAQRRLRRCRPQRRPGGAPAARLAIRHPRLCGGRPILAADGYRVIVPYLRGYGSTRFLSDDTARNGEQAALAVDAVALLDALGIDRAVVAGFDWGARTADIVAALWPERCSGLVSVSGYLIGSQAAGRQPLPPEAELQWWYQYYFATERGRDGYDANRREFAKLIWRTASPRWDFDDATFDRSAASFDNPDHVEIVIHNYRWRLGLADGEPQYATSRPGSPAAPAITVPTITLEGDANGAPHPEPSAYAGKFSGPYAHRTIEGGIGHNLPQEAPQAFADAILEVGELRAVRVL